MDTETPNGGSHGACPHQRLSEELACKSFAEAAPYASDPFAPVAKRTRFEVKLDAAKHPRWRKHKVKKNAPIPCVPTSHVAALLGEMISHSDVRRFDASVLLSGKRIVCGGSESIAGALGAGGLLLGAAVADGVEAVKRKLRAPKMRAEKEAALAIRRKYYAAETERRHRIAEQLRAAVPPPENARPTPEVLLQAYASRHESEAAALHFGRLMTDLEEHERYQVEVSGNRITGTTKGVRKWLAENCPSLAAHYHTCLRFKRKAQRDPVRPEEMD